MGSGIDPHKLDEQGYIVAWRHRTEFKAGKNLDEVMSFGEARKKAEELTARSEDTVYWAEPKPKEWEPH
jgi:hypothetical protein